MMKAIPTLEECKIRFAKFGECEHHHKEWVKPYGTTTQLETCMVCAKVFTRRYPTQAEMVESEIIIALESGITDKQLVYNKVAQVTDAPRSTIRRCAKNVRDELSRKLAILSETKQLRVATEYDCSGCGEKKIIKRTDVRCPKCQVILDWSDE